MTESMKPWKIISVRGAGKKRTVENVASDLEDALNLLTENGYNVDFQPSGKDFLVTGHDEDLIDEESTLKGERSHTLFNATFNEFASTPGQPIATVCLEKVQQVMNTASSEQLHLTILDCDESIVSHRRHHKGDCPEDCVYEKVFRALKDVLQNELKMSSN